MQMLSRQYCHGWEQLMVSLPWLGTLHGIAALVGNNSCITALVGNNSWYHCLGWEQLMVSLPWLGTTHGITAMAGNNSLYHCHG